MSDYRSLTHADFLRINYTSNMAAYYNNNTLSSSLHLVYTDNSILQWING